MQSHMASARVNRDVERSYLRARNGLRQVAGVSPPRISATPRELVWRRDKATLWRYPVAGATRRPPLLAFMGLVSRSYVLDLLPGNSFIAKLGEAGCDVFLLDWGTPDAADAANTLETYVDFYLPRAVEATCREAGTSEVSLLGYCMGATFALLLAASRPDVPVSGIAMLAAPLDFTKLSVFAQPLRDRTLEVDTLLDDEGMVPPEVLRTFFQVRKPTFELTQYANLWEKLANEKQLEGHVAMARWARDHVPFPGATFEQMTSMFLRGNGFMTDSVRLAGRHVSLRDLRIPLLSVIAEKDDIVPAAASTGLADLAPDAPVTEVRVPGGHAGLVMGRMAASTTVPAIAGWPPEEAAR